MGIAATSFAARDFGYNLLIISDTRTSPGQHNHAQFMTLILPRLVLSLVAAALLAGCASMDRSQCVSANWYAIGLEDGARGQPLERLGAHRRACAEHGIAPDGERYAAGRSEGLKTFCTYDRGFSQGRAGQAYSAVCPAGTAAAFQSGYQLGRDLWDLNRQLGDVQRQIARSKALLKEGIANPRQRASEVERLEDLTRESSELETKIARLESR